MRQICKWGSVFAMILVCGTARCQTTQALAMAFAEPRIEYCDADPDLVWASIHVTTTFSNRGKENMILSRSFGSNVQVAVSDESGVEFYRPDTHFYLTEKTAGPGDAPAPTMFEILMPGESAQRDFVVRVMVSKIAAHRIGSTPTPGTYLLSAVASVWPFYDDRPAVVNRTRALWKRYGTLVTTEVRIKGLRVQISPPQDLQACPSEQAARP
jgi:hypothetical protein